MKILKSILSNSFIAGRVIIPLVREYQPKVINNIIGTTTRNAAKKLSLK